MRRDAVITVRVPRPRRRRLETLARKEGRSLSQQIERLIESGLGEGNAGTAASVTGSTAGLLASEPVPEYADFRAVRTIKDPMDRMVLAAARVSGAKLVSSDDVFDGRGVERVWG